MCLPMPCLFAGKNPTMTVAVKSSATGLKRKERNTILWVKENKVPCLEVQLQSDRFGRRTGVSVQNICTQCRRR